MRRAASICLLAVVATATGCGDDDPCRAAVARYNACVEQNETKQAQLMRVEFAGTCNEEARIAGDEQPVPFRTWSERYLACPDADLAQECTCSSLTRDEAGPLFGSDA